VKEILKIIVLIIGKEVKNMKKTLITTSILTLAFVLFFSKSALAYRGDPNVKGPNYTPERHEAMLKAFEKKDYTAWKNLIGGRPITQKINASNFSKFVQMRNLMLQGKTAEANKIKAELGLGQGLGAGAGRGYRYNINK
jgi:hypothetical protein